MMRQATLPSVRRVRLICPEELGGAWDRIRREQRVPAAFSLEVEDAAEAASGAVAARSRVDLTALPFVTIDPPGSRDLDQAFHAERAGDGFVVHYAIADVAAFVPPDGPVDGAARDRGATTYLPDRGTPLYPAVLSAGAASLLPDGDRPAIAWRIALDASGAVEQVDVRRAMVRSRAALSYEDVQRSLDADRADDQARLLRQIGQLRTRQEHERGGVSLRLPSQEVKRTDGGYVLGYESPLAVESWNAQISLLTGICAAGIMARAGVGLVRTLPPPTSEMIARLRRAAGALSVSWPPGASYHDVIRRCDPNRPEHLAFLTEAARVFRGATYEVIDRPTTSPPEHAALATPYAHVTAPLRRLADRFANEVVIAACAGADPPDWAVAALAELPAAMARASQRQRAVDHAVVDVAECAVLTGHVGSTYDGVVVQRGRDSVTVQLRDPAVVVDVDADAEPGSEVLVRLLEVELAERRLRFALV
jgi:VacB/RNase II family 3'-5' exoribonuclease